MKLTKLITIFITTISLTLSVIGVKEFISTNSIIVYFLLSLVFSFIIFFLYEFISIKAKKQFDISTIGNVHFENASASTLQEVSTIDKNIFGLTGGLPYEVGKDWIRANPKSIIVMKDSNDKIIGYYILLFIKPDIFDLFLRDKINIIKLESDDLIDSEHIDQATKGYIGSFVCLRKKSPYTINMMLHLASELDKITARGNLKELYALAATKEGELLINKRFHFSPYNNNLKRSDNHTLYTKDISNIKSIISLYWKYS